MAQDLDDGEFWLPSEFLTDDDLLMDFETDYSNNRRSDDFSLRFGNFSGFNSDLSSPVEASTETESDEDDFISGLTRKMAHSTNSIKGLQLSGSPQSTLCGFKPGSNQSSPNSSSRVSSPPESRETIGWDLLYAAAGEVARMRMAEETATFHNSKLFAPPPTQQTNPPSNYYPTHTHTEAHLAFLQLQASHLLQYQRIKQQQMTKIGVWGQGKMEYHRRFHSGEKVTGEIGRTQGLSMAAWPTLQQSQQQPAGSGMRPVFPGETGGKKERTGTGVFLPRRVGDNTVETRKKPDAVLNHRSNAMFSQQRRSQIPQPATNQELRLPQEWTY